MKTRNHECIWTEAKMKKESRRILYITMDVFVVLLCVVMTMVRSSYRENQQQSRESARKILNMYSYNLQQQLRKSEEVAEVMKGVVISYKGIPDNFDGKVSVFPAGVDKQCRPGTQWPGDRGVSGTGKEIYGD